jgi:tail lysozyme
MSMGGGGGRPRFFGAQLEGLARQLDQLERVGRSPAMARQLAQNTVAAQQFARAYGQVEQQFLAANNASLLHHRRMTQVDAVLGRTGRSTGGLAGQFGRLGGQISGVTRLLGFGGLVTAATGAVLQMEKMSRATLNLANTARDLRQTRGELLESVQAAQRLGLSFDEAQKEITETSSRLEDIAQRGFGAMTEEMEKLGPFMFDLINKIVKMKQEGKGGNEIFQMYTKSLRNLTVEENVAVSRAMSHSTALRDINEQYAKNVKIVEASKEQADAYNQAMVTLRTNLDQLTIVLGSKAAPALVKFWQTMKQGLEDAKDVTSAEDWKKLLTTLGIIKPTGPQTEALTAPGTPFKDLYNERSGGLSTPMRFMSGSLDTMPYPYNQMRRSTNIEDRRGISVPGGSSAIILGEQLRIGQESNHTLIEIRDILQRMETGEAGAEGGGGGGGADAGAGRPTFRPGVGPGPRARARAARGGGEVDPISGLSTRNYGGGGGTGGGGGGGGGGGRVSRHPKAQSDRAMIVMDELIKGGYTPAQAAAVVGHATEESQVGALTNPRERAAGLIHWTPTGGRRNRMDAYLQSQGVSPGDYSSEGSLRAQARYFQIEARTTEAPGSRRFLAAGSNVTEAARGLQSNIRYGTQTTEARAAHARGHLAEYQRRQAAGGASGGGDPEGGRRGPRVTVRPLGEVPPSGSLPDAVMNPPTPQEGFGGVTGPPSGRFSPESSLMRSRFASLKGGEGREGRTPFGAAIDERNRIQDYIDREFKGARDKTEPEIPGFEEDINKMYETGGGARISRLSTPMGQRALIDSGGTNKWEGSAALDITVAGAAQVNTRRSMGFEPIRLTRTRQMPRPTAESGTGAVDAYE